MSILETILSDTRERVAHAKTLTPVAALGQRPAYHAPTLSLAKALRVPGGFAFLAECKQASPSEGFLRREYNPGTIAREYRHAAAAAISILTEPGHFRGSLDHLSSVRQAVDRPLLRKDFIIDSYQLHEARAYGADAVLLIAAALEPTQLVQLMEEAQKLGLEVLTEVHDENELAHLDVDSIDILGVNHRDLKTFEIDLTLSERIFPHAPKHVVRLAESGIRNGTDCARLKQAGADAFLVGTQLMKARSPGKALAALRRSTALALAAEPSYEPVHE